MTWSKALDVSLYWKTRSISLIVNVSSDFLQYQTISAMVPMGNNPARS